MQEIQDANSNISWAFGARFGTRPSVAQTKKVPVLKIPFALHKEAVSIIETDKKKYKLSFIFDAKIECTVEIKVINDHLYYQEKADSLNQEC